MCRFSSAFYDSKKHIISWTKLRLCYNSTFLCIMNKMVRITTFVLPKLVPNFKSVNFCIEQNKNLGPEWFFCFFCFFFFVFLNFCTIQKKSHQRSKTMSKTKLQTNEANAQNKNKPHSKNKPILSMYDNCLILVLSNIELVVQGYYL